MREETTGAVCPEASPPQNARHEARKLRFVRWQTIHRDLPDLPEDLADDIFWSSVAYRDFKPETEQYLAEHGIRGVLWP
jgi:hypothetical protein